MNVIFLDFDGVINTYHENVEKKIVVLVDICKECYASVVIEAGIKKYIDSKTLETNIKWVEEIFKLFKKYNIKCIGRTPVIGRNITSHQYLSVWKEDEIRVYLFNHPEIDHFVIIDDVTNSKKSDLNVLKEHLVQTKDYLDNPDEEGLTEKYKEEIKEKMKLENEYKKFAEKKHSMTR